MLTPRLFLMLCRIAAFSTAAYYYSDLKETFLGRKRGDSVRERASTIISIEDLETKQLFCDVKANSELFNSANKAFRKIEKIHKFLSKRTSDATHETVKRVFANYTALFDAVGFSPHRSFPDVFKNCGNTARIELLKDITLRVKNREAHIMLNIVLYTLSMLKARRKYGSTILSNSFGLSGYAKILTLLS
ncbi:hypothetical protein ENBRE01_0095 [Enteropsectra breve]|nr:hypothetical protein ENBRE01_0095 [Enteropsectra breve]